MENREEGVRLYDMAAEIRAKRAKRAAKVVKAEFTAEDEEKSLPRFVRKEGLLAVLFCCAVLGLSFAVASPFFGGAGEMDGALRAVGDALMSNSVIAPMFEGAVAASAEGDAEENDARVDALSVEEIPVISYLPYISAEQYIAAPPQKTEDFYGIMPARGEIISGFSYRDNPLYGRGETAKYEFHKGIDIPVPEGTELFAFADGTIIEAGENESHGIYTVIDHGNGYVSLYAHMSQALRGVGAVVKQGDIVGYSGQTGRVTGPHLHFELSKDGVLVDPEDYMK